MRPIKFRVWDTINKEFVDDMCIHTNGDLRCDRGRTAYCGYFIVQQFTGRSDDNGNEIYEGDIVVLSNGERCVADLIDVYVIPPDEVTVAIERANNGEFFGSRSESSYYRFQDYDSYKVIGNIFENPELLDKPKEL